jgi:hypothetical protein
MLSKIRAHLIKIIVVFLVVIVVLIFGMKFFSVTPPHNDPFAYCAAVETIDTPDGRYSGAKMPDAIIQG